MKVPHILYALIIIGLLLAGCKTKQSPPESPKSTVTTLSCAALRHGQAPYKDPLMDVSGSLVGDCLSLQYQYGGGCKTHEVELYWSGTWAESVPPVTHLYLSHNAHEDACKAIVSDKKDFDLKELRYEGLGQVVVDVHVEGAPLIRINYIYPAK